MITRQRQRMATSKQQLWTFHTSRRTYIFTMRQLIWRSVVVTVCGLCILAAVYSVSLVIRVRRSDQEQARIATAENMYAGKNWQELEESKKILLYAGESFAKRVGISSASADTGPTDADPERSIKRLLKEPYATFDEVKRLLGTPDVEDGAHWVWRRIQWVQPAGWPSKDTIDQPWPFVEEKLVEASFGMDGRLSSLILTRREPGGFQATEHIGRQVEEWKFSRPGSPSKEQ
jgi:hypothetical protein